MTSFFLQKDASNSNTCRMLSLLAREWENYQRQTCLAVQQTSCHSSHNWPPRQKRHCAHRLYWWKDTTSLLPSNTLRCCNPCHSCWGGMSRHMPQLPRWCLGSCRNSRSFHGTESSNHIHIPRKNILRSEWKEHYFICIFSYNSFHFPHGNMQAWNNSASTYCSTANEMLGSLEM